MSREQLPLGGSWRAHEFHRQRIFKEAHEREPFVRPAPSLTKAGMAGTLRAWAARNLLGGEDPATRALARCASTHELRPRRRSEAAAAR